MSALEYDCYETKNFKAFKERKEHSVEKRNVLELTLLLISLFTNFSYRGAVYKDLIVSATSRGIKNYIILFALL